jgi:hypothetical protein
VHPSQLPHYGVVVAALTEKPTKFVARWEPDPDDASRLRWWDGAGWTDSVATRDGSSWSFAIDAPSWSTAEQGQGSRIARRVGVVVGAVGVAANVGMLGWIIVIALVADAAGWGEERIASFDPGDAVIMWALIGGLVLVLVGLSVFLAFPPPRVRAETLAIESIMLAIGALTLFGILASPALLASAAVLAFRARARANDPSGRERGLASVALVVVAVSVLLVAPAYSVWNAAGNAT